ncbi:MAG TPA: hypothetical protein VEX41_07335 [Candidatus Eisenbacteria bacterium]|nr:hypothetical protein [Candidatus Eisenbacteria bacterium]
MAVLAISATMVLAAKPGSAGSPACEHGKSAAHTDKTGCADEETPGTDGTEGTESTEDTEGAEQGSGDTEAAKEPKAANEPKKTKSTDTEATGEGGDHCATDPTGLSESALAAMNHGSIVCWAAHQTSWPSIYANHGAFVSHWAHAGKDSTSHGKSAWGKSHKK